MLDGWTPLPSGHGSTFSWRLFDPVVIHLVVTVWKSDLSVQSLCKRHAREQIEIAADGAVDDLSAVGCEDLAS